MVGKNKNGKQYTPAHVSLRITGGKFYFDWLLISNPASKNSWIKHLHKGVVQANLTAGFGNKLEKRIATSKTLILEHFGGFLILLMMGYAGLRGGQTVFFGTVLFINIVTNLYPIWVQVYIGLRCRHVLRSRKK